MESANEHSIRICNGLLRGELSAVDTYTQAIEKHGSAQVGGVLRKIRTEHSQSANRLSADIRQMGGQPESDSGVWGMFVTAVQCGANLFGPDSAIDSLRQGEELGRGNYQDALLDVDVLPECKLMMRDELLPRVIHHIATLERLERELHDTAR